MQTLQAFAKGLDKNHAFESISSILVFYKYEGVIIIFL